QEPGRTGARSQRRYAATGQEADHDRSDVHPRSVPSAAMSVARFLVALCLVGLAARVAAADDPARDSARQHFERGEKLYAVTRFSEALEEYQKAFDAVPLAGFLFNIAQCYRNL